MARAFPPLPPHAEAVHVEIDDRGRKKRQHLAEDQAADDRNSQRDPQFRTDSYEAIAKWIAEIPETAKKLAELNEKLKPYDVR
jgi:hypothetical protein